MHLTHERQVQFLRFMGSCAPVCCRKQAVEVCKRRQADDARLQADGFDIQSLHVYETDPLDKGCKSWKLVKEVPFAH